MVLGRGYQRTRVLLKEIHLGVTNQRVKTFSEDQKKPCHHEHHLSLRLIVVTPHQFEKSKRIAHGMDLADLVGVNGADCDAQFFFMGGCVWMKFECETPSHPKTPEARQPFFLFGWRPI
jgi:hypothetical protein